MIYTHMGGEYTNFRSKGVDDCGIVYELRMFAGDQGKKLAPKSQAKVNFNAAFDAYVNVETAFDHERGFQHVHCVLVPTWMNIPIRDIPFMSYQDTLREYSKGSSTIPALEVLV